MTRQNLPASAAEVATYIDRVRQVHLHQGGCGWRLTDLETDKCGTTDCFVMRVKNVRETETPP